MSARLTTLTDTTVGPTHGRFAIAGHITFSPSAVPVVRACSDGRQHHQGWVRSLPCSTEARNNRVERPGIDSAKGFIEGLPGWFRSVRRPGS